MSEFSTPMLPDPDEEFGPGTYGSSFADVYDDWYADVSDAERTAEFVTRFGPNQRVLELGVGTGRLSTAMAAAGHEVVGIDSSPEMLARFDGATGAVATGADMSVLPIRDGVCDLVLVATNTLFNLTTADAQLRCFTEARRVTRLGGRFVVEAAVPGEPDPALDRLVTTRAISIDRVVLTATIRHEPAQTIRGQHIEITEDGIRLRPWMVRFAAPAELDRFAESIGFRLGERHAGWDATPFDDRSNRAVSVYVAV